MWEIVIQGQSAPIYCFDGQVLNQYLSSQSASAVIMVTFFDVIKRGTTVYGLVNDPPLPVAPTPAIAITQTTQAIIERS